MQFITGESALFFEEEKMLVIADLHIGIEYEFYRSGIKLPSQTEKMLERLEKLLRQTKTERLLLLGDIKHKVPGSSFQEEREIPYFLNHLKRLNQGIKVEIVPGNHDPGIENYLPKNVKLHGNKGIAIGDIYLTHGHTWPDKSMLKAKKIVSGHSHSQFEFRNKLGYRWTEPVWLRASVDKKKIESHYKQKPKADMEIIIVPPFNKLSGGYPINKERNDEKYKEFLGPVAKLISRKKKLYLLDGTFLGEF